MKPQETAQLCDDDASAQVVCLPWRHFGGRRQMQGPVATLSCEGHSGLIRDTFAQPGGGRVLVVDGGGSLAFALMGDRMAQRAIVNGWAGVVIHGAVRDAATLATLPLAIMALGTCPRRAGLESAGQLDVSFRLAGVTVQPGCFLVADDDGVVVLPAGKAPPHGVEQGP